MGRNPCCSKIGLNRGSWTASEDKILSDYINLHGEGRWRQLPMKAGLKRCGKSCRLRWLNYLKPDIKRGNISCDEEDLIIRLHKLLGNRWSLIAGRLPGRTDNEIKNYWNTRLAKKVHHNDDPHHHHLQHGPADDDDDDDDQLLILQEQPRHLKSHRSKDKECTHHVINYNNNKTAADMMMINNNAVKTKAARCSKTHFISPHEEEEEQEVVETPNNKQHMSIEAAAAAFIPPLYHHQSDNHHSSSTTTNINNNPSSFNLLLGTNIIAEGGSLSGLFNLDFGADSSFNLNDDDHHQLVMNGDNMISADSCSTMSITPTDASTHVFSKEIMDYNFSPIPEIGEECWPSSSSLS